MNGYQQSGSFGGGRGREGEGREVEGDWRGGHNGGSNVGIHSAPRVSYYFPKGVGEYHFGVSYQLLSLSSLVPSLSQIADIPLKGMYRSDIL